jgi:opacity protein-like surface antigen
MKRALLLLIISLIFSPLREVNAQKSIIGKIFRSFSPFAEVQTNNKVSFTQSDVKTAFFCYSSIAYGVEVPINIDRTKQVFGAGIEFQKSEVIDSAISFENMPVYWFYKQRISSDSSFYIPDIIIKLGYNFLTINAHPAYGNVDAEGGFFYAAGLSFNVHPHIGLRITYKSSQGKMTGVKKIMVDGKSTTTEYDYGVDNYKISMGFSIILSD